MEFYALGTGSAGCLKNWQSNFIIRQNGKILLIDNGSDNRFALDDMGIKVGDIDAVYISHGHADHSGGMENLGFCTFFNPTLKKPKLYGEANFIRELWDKGLKLGMEGLEGTWFEERKGDGVLLSTYFDVHPIVANSSFTWEGIKFDIVQTVHITCKYALVNSFGLMWTDPDTNERVYLTTDCQYSPEASMRAFYREADHVYQDCETMYLPNGTPIKSGVHAHYVDLCNLSADIKAKMWLYHYHDNIIDDYDTWNVRAMADGFRGFIKTYASFARSYSIQEAGMVGSMRYVYTKMFNEGKLNVK